MSLFDRVSYMTSLWRREFIGPRSELGEAQLVSAGRQMRAVPAGETAATLSVHERCFFHLFICDSQPTEDELHRQLRAGKRSKHAHARARAVISRHSQEIKKKSMGCVGIGETVSALRIPGTSGGIAKPSCQHSNLTPYSAL